MCLMGRRTWLGQDIKSEIGKGREGVREQGRDGAVVMNSIHNLVACYPMSRYL